MPVAGTHSQPVPLAPAGTPTLAKTDREQQDPNPY